ncbi:hypothetical protein BaRGS_00010192 [Batillaria attramentaria]|uniref:Uncharacterized protein n=1 Tax=Batillaria attramentaria TaxID=370345 RepID=A0ABD0LGR2_9CAEN
MQCRPFRAVGPYPPRCKFNIGDSEGAASTEWRFLHRLELSDEGLGPQCAAREREGRDQWLLQHREGRELARTIIGQAGKSRVDLQDKTLLQC